MPRKTKSLRRCENGELTEQDRDTLKEIIDAAKLPLKDDQIFEIQSTCVGHGQRVKGAWSWSIAIGGSHSIGSQFYFAEVMKARRGGGTKLYPLPDSPNDVEIIIMSMKR